MKAEIGLVGNPSTGYDWQSDREPDQVRYEEQYPSTDGEIFVGDSVFTMFLYDDVPSGTILTFTYLRSWESDTDPIQTVQLLVE